MFYEKIGKGHFAEVFLCTQKVTNLQYVAKVFRAPKVDEGAKLHGIRQEIETMKEVNTHRHPSVIRLVDVFFNSESTEFNHEYSTISIVQELVSEGELLNLIVSQKKLSQ
ncbi:hypothetical protein VHEMI03856 [[Torrubiella] hemipterigena]|uniref:Protein kinase domain-containing protein n=1 Tax=[Torrubiella] hemipterigena TaxID=1531966 RepID=A0A0A1TEL8_9HYPO|nr:hypothetical protein VHEMI03856 [[Torrubiella] hemipterigena]